MTSKPEVTQLMTSSQTLTLTLTDRLLEAKPEVARLMTSQTGSSTTDDVITNLKWPDNDKMLLLRWRSAMPSIKKEKKNKKWLTKKPKLVTCHVFAETTHAVASAHEFDVWSYLRHIYIFWVSSKSVQRFWSHGDRNWPFSITLAISFLQHLVLAYEP